MQAYRELQDYSVRAYLCDANLIRIDLDYPLERDERTVRVCFKPARSTEQENVSILTIHNFKFQKSRLGDEMQSRVAIEGGVAQSGTSMTCPGGPQSDCYFSTQLPENFFQTDGDVEGVGSIAMQFDARRLLRGNRRLQDFAGLVEVIIEFKIEDGLDKNIVDEAREGFKNYWENQPAYTKALYISGVVVIFLLCCCTCMGLIFWRSCCTEISSYWRRQDSEIDYEEDAIPQPDDGKFRDKGNLTAPQIRNSELGAQDTHDEDSFRDN